MGRHHHDMRMLFVKVQEEQETEKMLVSRIDLHHHHGVNDIDWYYSM